MGTARESNEIVIGTREGVTRCYAAKRMTEEDRWDAEEIKNMRTSHNSRTHKELGYIYPLVCT